MTASAVHAVPFPTPAVHEPSWLHGEGRVWSETNCYVDVWIELLDALGVEPLSICAFSLSATFEGTQWSFFKPSLDEVRAVTGIEVGEFNVWRPVLEHLVEEMGLGRLLTVEVDAWWLPDTAGVSYRAAHQKTTIVPGMVDTDRRVLHYFHGAGYHRLEGDDFEGIFAAGQLPPYVELIRLDGLVRPGRAEMPTIVRQAERHLRRASGENPIVRLGAYLGQMGDWLGVSGGDAFHGFAFGTCRQCGASAEIAAAFLRWIEEVSGIPTSPSADSYDIVAREAKATQFALARRARGRDVDVNGLLETMADAWERGRLNALRALSEGAR